MPRFRPFAFVLIAALAAASHADVVVTRTGTRYEGKIASEDSTSIVLETADLGTLRIPRVDVVEVTRGDARPAPAPAAAGPAPAPTAGAPAATPAASAAAATGAATESAAPAPETPEQIAARAEAERRAAEQAELDAAERMARRRASSIRRRTTPGAAAVETPAPEAAVEKPAATARAETHNETRPETRAEETRRALGGAGLAEETPGAQIVLFEPPRPFAAAPAGIVIGRRSFAHFRRAGAATAMLSVAVAGREEPLVVRLADVQRHVVAEREASRVRLFEGLEPDDWLRLRLDDGTFASGRFAEVDERTVTLRVPADEGAPTTSQVAVARVVQVDGLRASSALARAVESMEPGEPLGLVTWPDGREITGRFVGRMEHQMSLDADGDGQADTSVALDAPFADTRRIPPKWRETVRALQAGTPQRVRGFETYPDARVEREIAAPLVSVTAYTVSLRTPEGAAVVPFDALVACEPATPEQSEASSRHIAPEDLQLPVLPGQPAPARGTALPPGVTVATDGRVVTHVYVAPPFDRPVGGIRVGLRAAETVPYADLHFATEVIPAQGSDAPRELVSETVDGLRITAYVDPRGTLHALEIARR